MTLKNNFSEPKICIFNPNICHMPMAVLDSVSSQGWHSGWPPINMKAHVSAKSPWNISPNLSEVRTLGYLFWQLLKKKKLRKVIRITRGTCQSVVLGAGWAARGVIIDNNILFVYSGFQSIFFSMENDLPASQPCMESLTASLIGCDIIVN